MSLRASSENTQLELNAQSDELNTRLHSGGEFPTWQRQCLAESGIWKGEMGRQGLDDRLQKINRGLERIDEDEIVAKDIETYNTRTCRC